MEIIPGMHVCYIISMTATGIFSRSIVKFYRALPLFTEIYIVVYKNEWRQVN